MPIRIATWNLDYLPLTGDRAKACREVIDRIHPHVWVFTETRADFSPGEGYNIITQSGHACDLAANRRWTAIWARKGISYTPAPTSDPERTSCAGLELPDGIALYVYGTVLPWRGSTWKGIPSTGGQAFLAAIATQQADWSRLRADHPTTWLCVAGDFNQDLLDTGHYYGSKREREALIHSLEESRLTCLTGGKLDPVAKIDKNKANIDHICLGGSALQPINEAKADAWPPEQQGMKLSDHFGVVVEVNLH